MIFYSVRQYLNIVCDITGQTVLFLNSPAGLRGESNYHLAHLCPWQLHKLPNILLLLLRLKQKHKEYDESHFHT